MYLYYPLLCYVIMSSMLKKYLHILHHEAVACSKPFSCRPKIELSICAKI